MLLIITQKLLLHTQSRAISANYSSPINDFSEFGLKLFLVENLNNIKAESQANLTFYLRLKIK